jgi:dihydroorotate dehydrogenase
MTSLLQHFPCIFVPSPRLGALALIKPRAPIGSKNPYNPEPAPVLGLFDRLSRPLMRALDPEDAHGLAIKALRYMPLSRAAADAPALAVRAFGLNFPNPVGLAAGFDKNAQVADALLRLGFGFVEVGTVTPRAQAGNARPRLFRLEPDAAVINRLGFNNEGAPAVLARLAERARAREPGIVGVNIGANRDSADRAEDYVRLIESFAAVAGYFTINVSSPNTPGLRDLQQAGALDDLLARVIEARDRVKPRAGPTPVLLKIAPDLTLSELDDAVGIARKRRADGMIVGNTTLARPASLRARGKAGEAGGLSGRPLFKLSTRMLAETFVRAEGAFPLIGVGGIDSGPTAIAKIKAGATLVQLYTGLVFRGLGLLAEIKADLAAALQRGHRDSLAAMVGVDAAEMTAESWPA